MFDIRLANILNQIANSSSGGLQGVPDYTSGIGGNMPNPTSPTSPDMGVGNMNASPPQQQDNSDIMSQIAALFQPNNQQFNKVSQLVDQMPQRSSFHPSTMNKIAAFAAGLGTGSGAAHYYGGVPVGFEGDIPSGLKVQSAMLDKPYNDAMTDWKNKLEPTEKLSSIEGQRNTNDRLIGGQLLSNERATKERERKEAADAVKAEQGQQKIDIANKRADAYIGAKKFAQDHPNYKSLTDESGKVYFYNPQDPSAEPIYSGVDGASDLEKIDLRVEGSLKEIQARAKAAQDLEGTKQGNRMDLEKGKQIDRLDLKQTPVPTKPGSTSSTNKPESPTQTRVRIATDANNLKMSHPEWSKYITIENGLVSVRPPGGFTGPDKDTYNQIVSALGLKTGEPEKLIGDIQLPANGDKPKSTTPNNISKQSGNINQVELDKARKKLEPGYTLITKDGIHFDMIPTSNVPRLKPELGYTVVQ